MSGVAYLIIYLESEDGQLEEERKCRRLFLTAAASARRFLIAPLNGCAARRMKKISVVPGAIILESAR